MRTSGYSRPNLTIRYTSITDLVNGYTRSLRIDQVVTILGRNRTMCFADSTMVKAQAKGFCARGRAQVEWPRPG